VAKLLCRSLPTGEGNLEGPKPSSSNTDYTAFICLKTVNYGFHCSWKMWVAFVLLGVDQRPLAWS